MREYIVKGGKPLRLGYTTGSCASAAAAAAARMLLSGEEAEQVVIALPAGEEARFCLEDTTLAPGRAFCCVKKDAGDDPDVTDGMKICAECVFCEEGVVIAGGAGVGVVTADGLPVPKGEAAINPAPRKMITANVERLLAEYGYGQGIRITVSVPGGEAVARKTFNPRLGIEGGISILGTTGIVEPMSEKAMVDTIKLLIDRQYLHDPENILITPGNYGKNFISAALGLDINRAVKYSNFLGETLDYIKYKQFKRVLLVGHLGKMVKAAGGIMHTHSAVADCRLEVLTAHAAVAGADTALSRALMACVTTDAAVALLEESSLAPAVFDSLGGKILFHLRQRLGDAAQAELIVFLRDKSIIQSPGAKAMLSIFAGEKP